MGYFVAARLLYIMTSLAFGLAFAGSSFAQNTAVGTPGPWSFSLQAGTGIGYFQDIQLPHYISEYVRSDGRPVGEENVVHIGLPLQFRFGLAHNADAVAHWGFMADVTQQVNLDSPRESADASYMRLRSQVYRRWNFGRNYSLQLQTSLIRTQFANISIGHVVDHVAPGVALTTRLTRRWLLTASGDFAAFSKLRYDNGERVDSFKAGRAGLWGAELDLTYQLDKSAQFRMGSRFEQTAIEVDDDREYEAFGFSVRESFAPTKLSYQMQTAELIFGLQRIW